MRKSDPPWLNDADPLPVASVYRHREQWLILASISLADSFARSPFKGKFSWYDQYSPVRWLGVRLDLMSNSLVLVRLALFRLFSADVLARCDLRRNLPRDCQPVKAGCRSHLHAVFRFR